MPVKVSEKQLFGGVALLLIAVTIFLNATLFNAPVKISEKGLLFDLAAMVLVVLAVRLITKSVYRQK